MKETVKRGGEAVKQNIKATYAVKIGQKKSKWTEDRHAQKKRVALEKSRHNGNQLTKWFSHKPAMETIDLTEHSDEECGNTSTPATIIPESDPVVVVLSPAIPEPSLCLQSTEPVLPWSSSPSATPATLLPDEAQPTEPVRYSQNSPYVAAPSIDMEKLALQDIKNVLKPQQPLGYGYKDPKLDLVL
ncbi:hypothetical protein K439DRAFT_1620921 [Ramaria rubella]|nr:hypothetical protein K439DRAFT_1620921 [Ramaria rubella]